MANEVIKAWDIYVSDRKIGTMQKSESTIDAAGTLEQVAEGTIGRAQGPVTSKITVDVVTVFGGRANTQTLTDALLGNIPVKLTQGVVDGKLRSYYPMWCHNETQSTDFTSGQCTGKFSFEGVAPKMVG
jgi:hypothetical protein